MVIHVCRIWWKNQVPDIFSTSLLFHSKQLTQFFCRNLAITRKKCDRFYQVKGNFLLVIMKKNWKHETRLNDTVNVRVDDPLQIIGENANFFLLIGLGAHIWLIWFAKKTSTFFTLVTRLHARFLIQSLSPLFSPDQDYGELDQTSKSRLNLL